MEALAAKAPAATTAAAVPAAVPIITHLAPVPPRATTTQEAVPTWPLATRPALATMGPTAALTACCLAVTAAACSPLDPVPAAMAVATAVATAAVLEAVLTMAPIRRPPVTPSLATVLVSGQAPPCQPHPMCLGTEPWGKAPGVSLGEQGLSVPPVAWAPLGLGIVLDPAPPAASTSNLTKQMCVILSSAYI